MHTTDYGAVPHFPFPGTFPYICRRMYETCFMFILTNVNFIFSRLHVNKINKFCFLLNSGRVPGMAN